MLLGSLYLDQSTSSRAQKDVGGVSHRPESYREDSSRAPEKEVGSGAAHQPPMPLPR